MEHRGRSVVIIDLGGLVGNEILATLADAARIVRAHQPGTALTLTDATSVRFNLRDEDGGYNRAGAEAIRKYVGGNRPYVKAATVVVGSDEAKRIMVEFFNRVGEREFEIFDTRQRAPDWLVGQ